MFFNDLSRDQALRYRDHVVAREHPRLSDLAYWMADDGGPVDNMDGSPSSLVPLWSWFRDFRSRNFPGVALARLPSIYSVFAPNEPVDETMREAYVSESIEHYLAQVVFHLDEDARWTLYEWTSRGAVDSDFHETGVVTSTQHFILPSREVGHLRRLIHKNQESDPPDEALRRKLDGYDGWPHPGLQGRPLQNLLTPFLNKTRVPENDPARAVPVFSARVEVPADAHDDRAGGSVMLIGGHQPDEDLPPEHYPALPAVGVAGALSSAGFVRVGDRKIDSADLLVDSATFEQKRGWAVAWITVHEGALRAVTIRALDATDEEWKGLLLPLKEFAASIDATIE